MALTRRRTRLRTTAPPTSFAILSPIRELRGSRPPSRKTTKYVPALRRPRPRTRAKSPRRRRLAKVRMCLDGQAFAAFFTARGEDAAAVLRCHARHESVHALAATVMRLKSALHSRVSESTRNGPARGCAGQPFSIRSPRAVRQAAAGEIRTVRGFSTLVDKPVEKSAGRCVAIDRTTRTPAPFRATFLLRITRRKPRKVWDFCLFIALWISA